MAFGRLKNAIRKLKLKLEDIIHRRKSKKEKEVKDESEINVYYVKK